jgi:hypothetical protein
MSDGYYVLCFALVCVAIIVWLAAASLIGKFIRFGTDDDIPTKPDPRCHRAGSIEHFYRENGCE